MAGREGFFIEIVATTEQDAHKVFVAMNDRGLSLTSTEMLKGYLLSEIKSDSIREKMNGLWKEKVLALKKDDDKGDETFQGMAQSTLRRNNS